MTKVVYLYVYPTYTFTSLVQKIDDFYKNEFDKNTHVYFVGVFTQNEKIVYNYDNEEQISNANLENIQEQIFSTATNIKNIQTFRTSYKQKKQFQIEPKVSVDISHFLYKMKAKGEFDLQNFRWSTHPLGKNFFVLSRLI